MRLNRVLQITAAISVAMAATIFTISCSDGERGKDGVGCTLSANGGSYDVFCDGANVGTLGTPNGATGEPGNPGAPGNPGPDCVLSEGLSGTYQITCGGVVRGVLEGCHADDFGDDGTIISCLGSSGVGICNGLLYNPSQQICSSKSLLPLTTECGPDLVKYNSNTQYCGFLSKEALEAGTPAVLSICQTTGSPDHQPNEAETGDDTWKTLKTSDSWQDEYCQVNKIDPIEVDAITGLPKEVNTVAVPEQCGNSKVKLNENAWKREYCGYDSEAAVTKSKVFNACGDGGKPDEESFGKKICKMIAKTDKYSVTKGEEDGGAYGAFCFVGADSVRTPLNKVEKAVVNSADWQDQYCGYANKADYEAEVASVLNGICTTGGGPNDIDDGWDNQYCQGTSQAVNGKLVAATATVRAGGSDAYCIKEASDNYETASASARPNEGRWLNQYCGFASKADAEAGNLTRLTGVCDIGGGPNATAWDADYCQAAKTGVTTKVTGSTTTYCVADAADVPATQSYSKALNKDTWQGQYCGFSSKLNYDAHTGSAFKKTVISNNVCGDDAKPNETDWTNQFCQFKEDGTTELVDPGATTTNAEVLLTMFCPTDTTGFGGTYSATGNATGDGWPLKFSNTSNRLNVSKPASGKYQYCGYENYVGAQSNGATVNATNKIVFRRYQDICTNGDKPNGVVAVVTNQNRWLNEYCQGNPDDNTTEKVGFLTNATTLAGKDKYCGALTAVAEVAALTGSTGKLNLNSWQGQYCFNDNAIKACSAGQIPIGWTSSSPVGTVASTAAILCENP